MKLIDLNADLGEGSPFDDQLISLISSANVGCGEHAGSQELTISTVHKCHALGVRVGAHPGFPDRLTMGRRPPGRNEADAWFDSIFKQVERFARDGHVAYIKPHGAWYSLLSSDALTGAAANMDSLAGRAKSVLEAVCDGYNLPPMLLSGSPLLQSLREQGRPVIAEGFADRAYASNGSLVNRSNPLALINDPEIAAQQAVMLAESCDSICVHSDTPRCGEILAEVRTRLESAGWTVGF